MNFFRTVFNVCISFDSYREVRDLPVTASIKYLLKLATLLAFVFMLSLIPVALRGIETLAQRFDAGRPDFALQNGRVVTAAAAPTYWGDDVLRFGLLPEGKAVEPHPAAAYGLVFGEDRVVFWGTATNTTPPTVRQFETPLQGFPDGQVTGAYVSQFFRRSLPYLLPVGWVVLALAGTLLALLQAYMFSLIGSFMERTLPGSLTLGQLLNVTIHAVTPAGILITVYALLPLQGIDLWLVYLIAFGVFLLGATNACRDGKSAPEPDDPS